VRPIALKLTLSVTLVCAALGAAARGAPAQIAFAACGQSNTFACGHLTVPLDPSGAVPGTVTLALRRHRAPVGEARTAIIALAGGPGQPALPFAEPLTQLLGPLAATRDEILFDQRGVGLSHALACHAFEHPAGFRAVRPLVEACAAQLGTSRQFYATEDTVADIEAIRRAGGYEKLVLYGTSYGTKVAEEYAQQHPQQVEGLVLDSAVEANGPDPLNRATFAAIPGVLGALCARHACAHITRDPVADLARVRSRMRRAPLRGRAIDGHGRTHRVRISAESILDVLLAGDFNPLLRSQLLTATSSAAHGDDAPMARLLFSELAQGAEPEAQEDFDDPLFLTATCEDTQFPWSRASRPDERVAQARAAADALPAATFAPFTARDAIAFGNVQLCSGWPFTTPAPFVNTSPIPNVPTLVVSGTEDLRTPTANARAIAAQIPDARLLVVPDTGHSVLTSEPTSCAREALRKLFAPRTPKPCPALPLPPFLRPPPLPPTRLAAVSPAHGYSGTPGRTLHAVSLTFADMSNELVLRVLSATSLTSLLEAPALRLGGLRSGWVRLAGSGTILHDYSYVPGVTITGTLRSRSTVLHVTGSSAARGTLHNGPHGSLVGSLGGRHVRLAANVNASAAIVGGDAQSGLYSSAPGARARAAGARLARRFERFWPGNEVLP
jgi:pimeloyl-ACP methyl ester carboxylesterase